VIVDSGGARNGEVVVSYIQY